MRKLHEILENAGNKLQDSALLFLRLILAYGFYNPAVSKFKNMESVSGWFETMGYPLPHFTAYMVATFEFLGVILLAVGFAVRLISIPLMIIMLVAITTVHLKHGFDAGSNGFEVPLYYFIMLFALFAFGSGKYSLTHLICKKK